MSTQVVDEAPAVPLSAVATKTQQSTGGKDFFNWKPRNDDDSLTAELSGGGAAAASAESAMPLPGDATVAVHSQEPQSPSNPMASMSQQSLKVAKEGLSR